MLMDLAGSTVMKCRELHPLRGRGFRGQNINADRMGWVLTGIRSKTIYKSKLNELIVHCLLNQPVRSLKMAGCHSHGVPLCKKITFVELNL